MPRPMPVSITIPQLQLDVATLWGICPFNSVFQEEVTLASVCKQQSSGIGKDVAYEHSPLLLVGVLTGSTFL